MKKNFCLLLLLLLFCNCGEKEEDFISFSCDRLMFAWSESIKVFIVETDAPWRVSSTSPSWLTINTMQGGSGSTSVLVKASDNDTGALRLGIITFATPNGEKQLQIVQKAKEKLKFLGEKNRRITHSATKLLIKVDLNIEYELRIPKEVQDWIKQGTTESTNNGTLVEHIDYSLSAVGGNIINLEFAENRKTQERYAEIAICNEEFNLSDTLYITQEAGTGIDNYQDGEYIQLQQATVSKGVNLIVMGDGFTQQDMAMNGRYETIMQQAVDYFFSIEPYKSYRNYFNAYMVVAESKEAGVGTLNTFNGTVNNKFGTSFGSGTGITCDDDLCFEYAQKVKELPSDQPLIIIMPLNSTKYAGTTYLYANGNSIALCPMSAEAPPNNFEGVIHHEAGGHGFGFLCDEYVYNKAKMPESRKQNIRDWQKLGFQMNLDFTNDLSRILWKEFIGIDKYNQVDAYEGGYEYQYGVWRSEQNSCMNNNIPYFNVQSRWNIVQRIGKLAGVNFTIRDFIEADHITHWDSKTRSVSVGEVFPLGDPIWIK